MLKLPLAVRLQGGVRAIKGMALVEDEGHVPSGVFSWEVQTHGTPSDSTTNSLASNKPFQSPSCRSRAPNSEVPPPPPPEKTRPAQKGDPNRRLNWLVTKNTEKWGILL